MMGDIMVLFSLLVYSIAVSLTVYFGREAMKTGGGVFWKLAAIGGICTILGFLFILDVYVG